MLRRVVPLCVKVGFRIGIVAFDIFASLDATAQVPGPNVNMLSGKTLPDGDPRVRGSGVGAGARREASWRGDGDVPRRLADRSPAAGGAAVLVGTRARRAGRDPGDTAELSGVSGVARSEQGSAGDGHTKTACSVGPRRDALGSLTTVV